jgi:ABC-2 type transport system permease protein
MALAGTTALLVGGWPRLTWLAWVPLLASAVLALLGDLLDLPSSVSDAGVFGHVPDAGAAGPDARALLILLGIGAATGVLGLAGVVRRDVTVG